jgi:hypothetical protein
MELPSPIYVISALLDFDDEADIRAVRCKIS